MVTLSKEQLNIVWFKRDLRFTDHEPLYSAQQHHLPVLFIYCFEPSIIAYHDSDIRHWRFIHESLMEMNDKLKNIKAQLYIFHQEALFVFQQLANQYSIQNIFSHQEIGNKLTYERDICLQLKVLKRNNLSLKTKKARTCSGFFYGLDFGKLMK